MFSNALLCHRLCPRRSSVQHFINCSLLCWQGIFLDKAFFQSSPVLNEVKAECKLLNIYSYVILIDRFTLLLVLWLLHVNGAHQNLGRPWLESWTVTLKPLAIKYKSGVVTTFSTSSPWYHLPVHYGYTSSGQLYCEPFCSVLKYLRVLTEARPNILQ